MAKKKRGGASKNTLEIQNAAKTLFANIRFMSPDDPVKSLVITSAVPNEGKTTVSLQLASAMATSGQQVLLVETDMRRRSLANALGVHPVGGIYAVLANEISLETAVVPTSTAGLYFLDVEPSIPNLADIISSHRFANLVNSLENKFNYIIYDTPPVGTFVDAAVLSTLVDGTVLVLRPNSTKRADLIHGYEQLVKSDANILGLCATFCEGTGSEYYYAYYTRSGKRVDHKDIIDTPKNQQPPVATDPHYPRRGHR